MPRKIVFFAVLIGITLLFSVRLFYIQILNEDYAARAERNATASEKLYAPRGYVYDRDGRLMIGNSPTYDLMVSPYLVKNLDTAGFAKLLDISTEEVKERLNKAKKYSYFRSSMFMKMLPKALYTSISTELKQYPGFFAQKRILRNYPEPGAANVVGFIGEVNTEFIRENDGYSLRGIWLEKVELTKATRTTSRANTGSDSTS